MNKLNKKIIIILSAIALFIILFICIFLFCLTPVKNLNENVTFVVNKSESKMVIIDHLKDANLIRSKYATLFYIVLSRNTNIKAGSYDLSRDMSTNDIIKSLVRGDVIEVKRPTAKITFKEGDTLKKYLKLISDETNLEYDEIIKIINDETFLKGLIADYWFLTEDILDNDIYYALEGYLYPNTYEVYKETDLNTVVRKFLDVMEKNLEPLKKDIEKSGLSVHEILSMAAIAEKEAISYDDRQKVAQVIFKRLELNMSLGMDVTAYYGVQKDMKEVITSADLANNNPYNTRLVTFLGLPAGPICNPSIESIKAVLNPADTEYVYFFADIKTGKVYFTDNINEFNEFKRIYG